MMKITASVSIELMIGILAIGVITASISLTSIALIGGLEVEAADTGDQSQIPDDEDLECGRPNATRMKGLLIVAHGMPGQWNARVKKTMTNVNVGYPAEVAFLEYSPFMTISNGVDALLEQEVGSIIAVPIFICGNSSHTQEVIEAVERAVDGRTELFITESMDEHDLIVQILIDHGLDLCSKDPYRPRDRVIDPEEASLILFAHGDNNEFFENWELMAEEVIDKIEGQLIFKEVRVAWAGNDNLKEQVKAAKGAPLIVPWMMAYSEYSDADIRKQLLGLDYEYDGKHLMDHPNSINWVEWEFENYYRTTVWVDIPEGDTIIG